MTRTETRRFDRRRKVVAAITAIVVIAGLVTTCAVTKPWNLIGHLTAGEQSGSAASRNVDVATLRTASVTKGVLNAETRLGATLQYDKANDFAAATGTITQLPVAGKQINTGEQVYEMDGVPVPLFHGERPFWRTLQTDVADGPDVTQLEQNLVELGFFSGAPDTHFDWLTREAVRQWQRSLGLTGDAADGVFQPSSVALASSAPIRITQVKAKLGESNVSPASYTNVTLHVEATLTATQAATFKAGDKAQVVLPDNTTLDTTLTAVDQGGQSTGTDGQVTSPSARVDFPDQSQVAQFGPVAVSLVIPNTSASANTETLIVPVTAIVASAGTTYAVDVVRGDALVRVPVEIGLVADAQVQLTKADGLKTGDKVVVS
ncbi:peptidoglycan-binding domain-containing protein [Bifidobacterium simiiventris]|uniref:peptidoglycan-binding domain-containing protein n=1 Tax=Bifidobacterium simiiventris TaxID=2834434 RepID=UPI001C565ED7|nr:peptidoglycan-binding domain-containing protein [Bifidobacterium simiiventris]MBW3078760.1 peptidoglycan-binding protein [Bifidobacterium simiiventris]